MTTNDFVIKCSRCGRTVINEFCHDIGKVRQREPGCEELTALRLAGVMVLHIDCAKCSLARDKLRKEERRLWRLRRARVRA